MFNFTGGKERRDARESFADTSNILNKGANQARGELAGGYGSADRFLSQAGVGINAGYDQAGSAINRGQREATGYLNPYAQSGTRANNLYGNALGLNGLTAQQGFGQNYAANDPFRAQNSEFATEDLMRSLNARGMSGSGYAAEAVAQQSLRRGSEDYNNYLNRLSGVRDTGQQAATNLASLSGQFAGQRSGLATGRGAAQGNVFGDRATNATGRGNALSNLTYGNAQQIAGQRVGLGNALSATRQTGMNNFFKLGQLGVGAASAAMGVPSGGGESLPWLNGGRGGQASTWG